MDGLWSALLAILGEELAGAGDTATMLRAILRLMAAAAFGAVLGYEREIRGTGAGLRTHMLVAVGAALFIVVPVSANMESDDMSRVLQGLISGIGFLGAGAIIKLSEDKEIKGLTTAASIWLTAAIGVAVGMGQHLLALFGTLLGLFILVLSHPKAKEQDK